MKEQRERQVREEFEMKRKERWQLEKGGRGQSKGKKTRLKWSSKWGGEFS